MTTDQRTEGQDLVSSAFEAQAAAANIRVDGAAWHETTEGFNYGFQLLVVNANGKTFNTRFDDDNLEDSPATPVVQFALGEQVKDLVRRIQAGDDSDHDRPQRRS
jgi:hypothetical protein